MSDYTELANRIVGHGVGKFYGPTETQSGGFSVPRDGTEKLYIYAASEFVRDGHVVLAMLELCEARCVDWDVLEPAHWRNVNHTSSTPVAINTACCDALDEK